MEIIIDVVIGTIIIAVITEVFILYFINKDIGGN